MGGTIPIMKDVVELKRLLHNLIRIGTIADVDHAAARVRLADGDLLTDWRPWLTPRAGSTRDWDPPTKGEQAMLFCPGGDPAAAVVVTGLFSTQHPAPDNTPDHDRRVYPDGAVIDYNHKTHHLDATIPGSVALTADTTVDAHAGGNITIHSDADISMTAAGNVLITGARVDVNP